MKQLRQYLMQQITRALKWSMQIVGMMCVLLLGVDIASEVYLAHSIQNTLQSGKPLKEIMHALFKSDDTLYQASRYFQNYKNLNTLALAERVTGREYTQDYYGIIHSLLVEHNERYADNKEQVEMDIRISRDARFMLKMYESYSEIQKN